MMKARKLLLTAILSVLTALVLCFGIVFAMPTKLASAAELSTEGWTLAHEGDSMFRIQNGTIYWTKNTNYATTESMLDYTELNGETLSEINRKTPGAVTVTLQAPGGAIGSFYRVNINTEIAGFTTQDIGTVVVRSGWSHTDESGTYTMGSDLYFARRQNTQSQNDTWKYIPITNVVDISDTLVVQDQGALYSNSCTILVKTAGVKTWTTSPATPNEGSAAFLNTLYVNGKSVRAWNKQALEMLENGEIPDLIFGVNQEHIATGSATYAPIMTLNGYADGLGSYMQTTIPTGYIDSISSFKVCKGFANLADDGKLYIAEKDVEYVRSGSAFVKVASTVDISDAFKLTVQNRDDGTMLYYLHTNKVKYWEQQYGTGNAYAINESEWKDEPNALKQGGAVQMSYLALNGVSLYDINANDNGAYGATQGNIASGSKYAPILAFLTPQEMGDSIKIQIPKAYPSGSGDATTNHKTLTIKNGFYVLDSSTNIKYEVTKDIQWDYLNGEWSEHVETIEAQVSHVAMFGDSGDAFAGIAIEGSAYAKAPNTYVGAVKTAKSFAQSAGFRSYVLIDDQPLATPGEAFLNVWGNYGYFTFRPGNNAATKITVLAGCRLPTYDALLNGTNEVYVTTEDVTFVKDSDGKWVKEEEKVQIQPGEYNTSVSNVVYARDNQNNWMMFTLTGTDYPSASTVYNVATTKEQISALNIYDKIIVDGYTLNVLMSLYGLPIESPQINLWKANCFAIRIAGHEGLLTGAQTVTIKAGAQFPSYAYITEGIEAYYVTTENITFVNVGAGNGEWERQYRATFCVNGKVLDVIDYVKSQGLTAPAVPEKEGYIGAWESYTANGDITVNAVYTKKPLALDTTGIEKLRRIDNNSNILVIQPSNSDYPADANKPLNDVKHLQYFNLLDYITINGITLRELGVTEAALNKFTRPGLGLTTKLSNSMVIEIKKGCELPSYAFWKNPSVETVSYYVVDADYTATYSCGGEDAFNITPEGLDLGDITNNHYVLSDLAQDGYVKTACFEDGWEQVTCASGEAGYRYGYVNPTSFSLTFDLNITGASYGDTFQINLGTEGHEGNKYHFGWRFYLLRGSEKDGITQNICVEYFSNTSKHEGNIPKSAEKGLGDKAFAMGKTYRVTIAYQLVNASTGEVKVFTAVNQYRKTDTYELGGTFVNFAKYANSLTMNLGLGENSSGNSVVVVSNPGMMDENGDTLPKATFAMDGETLFAEQAETVVLPSLNPLDYNKEGYVFVGWTTENVTANLYPAGHKYDLTEDTTFYPVWVKLATVYGAGVRRTIGTSGIRFQVEIDWAEASDAVDAGWISEFGILVAPTDYLEYKAFTHDALGKGNYTGTVWPDIESGQYVYSVAFININYDQYDRSFSARGYFAINYSTGEQGYVYADYDQEKNSRSIYEVAKMAYNHIYRDDEAVQAYVNNVVDLTMDTSFVLKKASNAGAYGLTVSFDENASFYTVTLDTPVNAATINGSPLVMGKETRFMVGTSEYLVKNYKLSNDGKTLYFTCDKEEVQIEYDGEYYLDLIRAYGERAGYTELHKQYILGVVKKAEQDTRWETSQCLDAYNEYITLLKSVKTSAELTANNTGRALAAPVVSKGLGYTVTWNAVANADYYYVYDDNDYRAYTVVKANGGNALTYETEVIGAHNVYVVAHSYFEAYNSSVKSNVVKATPVKPAFSYKSMLDGLYKFSSSQMKTMGISTTGCYYDKNDGKYFVYYNKEIGWTPYAALATDWTSPEEFPAHAARLKAMGNNVILLAYDSNGMYRESDTWAASRLKYVMDTAWSMGMKVLVCDEIFYKYSMSDGSKSAATSKTQVTNAINAREGFASYVTHPAFYGFSLDDEPYGKYISAMSYTISALKEACAKLGVQDVFYLACLFQAQGGELGTEIYLTQDSLKAYYDKWLAIDGVNGKYLYVDIYTQHAMDQPTNRYNTSFEVVYEEEYLGGKYDFYQAITAHTQNDGVLLEQDLYMSMLYAAAHDVAGYSWFCYFPISAELAGSLAGFDGNGYGNGIGNNVEEGKSFYNAAATAAYQFELLQGLLDGYDWKTRNHNDSKNLLTTTLYNGTKTATMYVNADVDSMSGSVTVTASGSECYLVGYGVGTADAPYQAVSGSVTLAPGQAVVCIS